MNSALKEEIFRAYFMWLRHYEHRIEDQEVEPFLVDGILGFSQISSTWLKSTRNALGLTADVVAHNLGVIRSTYMGLEASEQQGAIRLRTLAAAAEAMNCELVYGIRPKAKHSYSMEVWKRILPSALEITSSQQVTSLRHESALCAEALKIWRKQRRRQS